MPKVRGQYTTQGFKHIVSVYELPHRFIFYDKPSLILVKPCHQVIHNPPPYKGIFLPDYVSKKVYPIGYRMYNTVSLVYNKRQSGFNKYPYLISYLLKPLPGRMEDQKIIAIPDIVPAFKGVLCKLVKFIQIHVGKELTRQITHRQTSVFRGMKEALMPWQMPQQIHITLYHTHLSVIQLPLFVIQLPLFVIPAKAGIHNGREKPVNCPMFKPRASSTKAVIHKGLSTQDLHSL
ncbi:hypothetical protein MBAV_000666 [Candidatus Magnetobacterium bavaricum]|uniref:Uncharacterized protein n=1 Tax=Candidatus Magnetobacterium bavaricum TaxID=29290 RepID=A0A0F3GZ29_9BACT|nr:hypothetical protein MBAV_000666 [Candidatus Magnetobacterium bavaricum]